jgi:hypothetical protein
MKQGSQPEFISVPDACEILGISDVWCLKLIHSGHLDAFKLSPRAWAVRRKSVMHEKRRHEATVGKSRGRGRPRRGDAA